MIKSEEKPRYPVVGDGPYLCRDCKHFYLPEGWDFSSELCLLCSLVQ